MPKVRRILPMKSTNLIKTQENFALTLVNFGSTQYFGNFIEASRGKSGEKNDWLKSYVNRLDWTVWKTFSRWGAREESPQYFYPAILWASNGMQIYNCKHAIQLLKLVPYIHMHYMNTYIFQPKVITAIKKPTLHTLSSKDFDKHWFSIKEFNSWPQVFIRLQGHLKKVTKEYGQWDEDLSSANCWRNLQMWVAPICRTEFVTCLMG